MERRRGGTRVARHRPYIVAVSRPLFRERGALLFLRGMLKWRRRAPGERRERERIVHLGVVDEKNRVDPNQPASEWFGSVRGLQARALARVNDRDKSGPEFN